MRVTDNGSGMPVGMHPTQKKPTVEVILTVLHAGGKFDSEAYAVSGGLHGVGVSVVNALSSRLEVEIDRDGFHWSQPYVNQKPAAPLLKGEPTKKHGTTVTFWADETIFETVTYNFETISRRLQEMAFLNKGLTIVLRDERAEKVVDENDAEAAPKAAQGPEGGHLPLRRRHRRLRPAPQRLEGSDPQGPDLLRRRGQSAENKVSLEIAMQWNSTYSESVYTFANTINTIEGGTHEEGFRAALTTVVNKWAIDKKVIKDTKEDRFSGDDIREGLAAIVSIKLGEPQFEGQTKAKLGNSSAKTFVQQVCTRQADRLVRAQPGRSQDRRQQDLAGGARPKGRAAGAQAVAQERARHVRHAGQARRLPLDRPGPERAVHRRG